MKLAQAIFLSMAMSTALTLLLEPNSTYTRFLIGIVSGLFCSHIVRNSDEL